jgi:hypothetical protein
MHFAETTADTLVGLGDNGFTALIRMNYLFRTESHANTAGLAPVTVKSDIVQLLFWGRLFFRRLLLVYRWFFCFFCHAFRHSKRKKSYWGEEYHHHLTSADSSRLTGSVGKNQAVLCSSIEAEKEKGLYFLVAIGNQGSLTCSYYQLFLTKNRGLYSQAEWKIFSQLKFLFTHNYRK